MRDDSEGSEEQALCPYDDENFDSVSMGQSTVVSEVAAGRIWEHELQRELNLNDHRSPPAVPINVQTQLVTNVTLSASDAKNSKVKIFYGILGILIFTAVVAAAFSMMSSEGGDGPDIQTTTPETNEDLTCKYLKGFELCFANKEKRDAKCAKQSCELKKSFDYAILKKGNEIGICFCCDCDPNAGKYDISKYKQPGDVPIETTKLWNGHVENDKTTTPSDRSNADLICKNTIGKGEFHQCTINKDRNNERCASQSCEHKKSYEYHVLAATKMFYICFCCDCDPNTHKNMNF